MDNSIELLKKELNSEASSQYENIALFFKAMGDETRVKIMYALSVQELCVQELTKILDASSSLVSHQLSNLKSLKIVKQRRVGKNVYYSLDDGHVIDILNLAIKHNNHK